MPWVHIFIWNYLKIIQNLQFFIAANVCLGSNEVYTTTAANTCERTCGRLEIAGCVGTCSGAPCVCATGYIRNNQGVCVPNAQCR